MKLKYCLEKLAEILLLFAACACIYFVIKLVPALAAKGYTGETTGTASIVQTVEDSGGNASGTKHRVYVDYSVDGKDYYTVVIHGRFDEPQVGDTYHIRYHTGNPEKCYVDSRPNDTLERYTVMLLAAMTLTVISYLGVKYLNPKQEEESGAHMAFTGVPHDSELPKEETS